MPEPREVLRGDGEPVWKDAPDDETLIASFNTPPGFGKRKVRIFLALPGERPEAPRRVAGPEALVEVRESPGSRAGKGIPASWGPRSGPSL